MFRTLAFLSSVGQLQAFEDSVSCIQRQQGHEALEALSSFEESDLVLPDVGSDGIRMSRLSSFAEAGSSFLLNYSHFCEQEDAFGPKECALYFDMPFKQTFSVFLNGGLNPGDVIHETFNVDLEHNESNFWSFLVPKSFLIESSCEFCQNSCVWSEVKPHHSLKITVPSMLGHESICDASSTLNKQQRFVFFNQTTFWPKPPAALDVKGNVTSTTEVRDKDDNTRLSGSYIFRLASSTPPAMLAATNLNQIVGGEGSAVPEVHPLALLKDIAFGPFDDLIQKATEAVAGSQDPSAMLDPTAWIAKSAGNGSHLLVLNLTVKSLNPGSSISINFDNGCTVTDSLGSISCEFAYGDSANITSALNIGYTAVEGSNMYTSSKISVGGNVGMLIGDKLFKKTESVTPLCGDGQVSFLKKKGLSRSFRSMKCGDYRFEFSSSNQEFTNKADIKNFAIPSIPFLPFLPKTFDELLPVTMVKEMKLRNQDNSTISAIELSVGLKKA